MAEKILFPMSSMRVTTGVNELSHLGSNAIDIAGDDQGIQSAFAPFTGTIKKIYKNGNTVWLESNSKVEYADGRIDYVTVSMTHDNNVSDLSVGKVIKQGEVFYQEGTNNATGNHIHLEVGVGKFTGSGWYQNSYGNWVINNSIEPWKAFWLLDTKIIYDHGYPWKELEMSDNSISKEDIKYNYKGLGGYTPTQKEIDDQYKKAEQGQTYKQITQSMKSYWFERGEDYESYKKKAEKQIADLKKQLEEATAGYVELKPGKYLVK